MLINHVMSNDVNSGIFNDIMRYFNIYVTPDVTISVTNKPLANADLYHYHRPHLEQALKSPSVCTVHHDLEETDNWLDYNKFHDIYKSASIIVCLNSNQENFLRQQGIEHTAVIPHGYNPNIFSSKPNRSERSDKITLGLVSKRYGRKVKGEEYIYELIKYLSPKDFDFILVGEGRSHDATIIKRLGYSVQVFEYLPYSIFGSLYENIDLLLMTSYHEGGPANVPEAVCTGTPIAGNNIGMITDYLVDGKNGFVLTMDPAIDYVKFESFKKNIDVYFKSASGMASKAITWEQNINMHLEIYNKILN